MTSMPSASGFTMVTDDQGDAAFGVVLKRLRIAAGLSQESLAERARMSVQAVSALERGARRAPYRSTVALLVGGLGLHGEERALLERAAAAGRPRLGACGPADDAASADGATPTNLPHAPTRLLGRDDDVAGVVTRLAKTRLLTLTGTGGVGKTRLAIEASHVVRRAFPDGTWFIELAGTADPRLVTHVVAGIVNPMNSDGADAPLEVVRNALRTKRVLLVLDNCEHVIEAVARLSEAILRDCSGVSIVATSRERLRVPGEHLYVVAPLALPPRDQTLNAADALTYAAIALFDERARAVDPCFAVTDTNAALIAAICRRLDGIALAIELAAPRVRVLSVAALAASLDDRFTVLTGGGRTALPRQQTLEALIGWSYDLLSESERVVFRRLAVFRGGWTLDQASDICGLEENDTFERIAALVDKSLVTRSRQAGRDERLSLLETTRMFALRRLVQAGEADWIAARHCDYYRTFAERWYRARWIANNDQWRTEIMSEIDNLRVALDWSVRKGNEVASGASIAAYLTPWWIDNASRSEGRTWLMLAAERLGADAPAHVAAPLWLARARLGLAGSDGLERAVALYRQGDDVSGLVLALTAYGEMLYGAKPERSLALLDEALVLARCLGNPRILANVLIARSAAHFGIDGRRDTLREAYHEWLDLLRRNDDPRTLMYGLLKISQCWFRAGDAEAALEASREALALARRCESTRRVMECLALRAEYLLAVERSEEARDDALESLRLARQCNDACWEAVAVQHLASIALSRADEERAAQLLGYTLRLHPIAACTYGEHLGRDRALEALRSAVPAAELERLLRAGAALDEQSALSLASAM